MPPALFFQKPLGEDQMLFWKRADSEWQFDGGLSSLEGLQIGLIRDYAYSPAFDALMAMAPSEPNSSARTMPCTRISGN